MCSALVLPRVGTSWLHTQMVGVRIAGPRDRQAASGPEGYINTGLIEVVSNWFCGLLNKFKIHDWKLPWSNVLTLDDVARAEEAERLGFASFEALGDRELKRPGKSAPEYKAVGHLNFLLRNAVDPIPCSLIRSIVTWSNACSTYCHG